MEKCNENSPGNNTISMKAPRAYGTFRSEGNTASQHCQNVAWNFWISLISSLSMVDGILLPGQEDECTSFLYLPT